MSVVSVAVRWRSSWLELDLLAGDGAELAAGLAEPLRQRGRAGLGTGQFGLDGRDLALEFGDVGLAVRALAREVEAAGGDGRVGLRSDPALAVGAEPTQARVDPSHVGVAGRVAAQVGVLLVDLLQQPLERAISVSRSVVSTADGTAALRSRRWGIEARSSRSCPRRARWVCASTRAMSSWPWSCPIWLTLTRVCSSSPAAFSAVMNRSSWLLDLVELALAAGDLLVQHLARPRRARSREVDWVSASYSAV